MRKQLVAALLAVVLAAAGVFALLSYANGANDRAYAGVKLVKVLQVQSDVPVGTPVERLGKSVELVEVPAATRIAGALQSLDAVAGKSTNTALIKGEQVLPSRFGGKKAVRSDSSVPTGYQEVTILLAPPRIPSVKLKPGDRVGVVASYKAKNGDGGYTNFLQQQVRVTRVATTGLAESADGATAGVLVTLAVRTRDAEKIVNAAEFGMLHLTLQSSQTDTSGRKRIDGQDVLR